MGPVSDFDGVACYSVRARRSYSNYLIHDSQSSRYGQPRLPQPSGAGTFSKDHWELVDGNVITLTLTMDAPVVSIQSTYRQRWNAVTHHCEPFAIEHHCSAAARFGRSLPAEREPLTHPVFDDIQSNLCQRRAASEKRPETTCAKCRRSTLYAAARG